MTDVDKFVQKLIEATKEKKLEWHRLLLWTPQTTLFYTTSFRTMARKEVDESSHNW